MRPLLAVLFASWLVCGCDPTPVPTDAPVASTMDAGRDVIIARRDAPELVCPSGCESFEHCCDIEGTLTCLALASDILHCGDCTNDCVALDRGDGCANGMCSCGDVEIGCLGGIASTCCVTASGAGNCADLRNDFDDCGACNARCDAAVADHCEVGECACGESDEACGGGTTCCSPRFGGGPAECVSLDTSVEHCGECQFRCGPLELCRDGLCVSSRDAGPPRDAGLDASLPDGGSAPVDAGPGLDAGAEPDAAETDAP